ncbi:ECF-type sigma factor [Roseibacillus persicicus]|uniref:ECF-type sigma factor n=1 Tax=Roseibacillus persicicus TaxID=454148 RepID=UPI00398B56B8
MKSQTGNQSVEDMSDEILEFEKTLLAGKYLGADLLPLVYDELRQLANRRMAQENSQATLQPTALVHEAWLRLDRTGDRLWENREHFFNAAALSMRRILVDRAREKSRNKRKGSTTLLDLDTLDIAGNAPEERILMVDELLQQLEKEDEESACFINLKFFAGLTTKQLADLYETSERSIERKWSYARATFYQLVQRECYSEI